MSRAPIKSKLLCVPGGSETTSNNFRQNNSDLFQNINEVKCTSHFHFEPHDHNWSIYISKRMPHQSSIITFISVSLCWFHVTESALSGGFDNSRLHQLAQASSLSYLSMDSMTSSPYLEMSKLTPIAQVLDRQSESGATIFRTFDDTALVVACRGSATPLNFSTNLRFTLVPATQLTLDFVPENALVHEGFQMASVGLWKEMSKSVINYLDSSISEIIFTGHSLGAATALLCATQYTNTFKEYLSPSVVTFGGPKLCNSIFARHLRQEVLKGCQILHVIHTRDPVLANNKALWDSLGFESAGVEVECDPYSPIVWDRQDPSGTVFAWNFVDHCKYMVCLFTFCITTEQINQQYSNTSFRECIWDQGSFFRRYVIKSAALLSTYFPC